VDQESGIDYNWEDFAACKDLPKEQKDDFFPEKADGHGKKQVNRARRICLDCPVVVECLHAALVTNEKFGVWGMTSPKQRRLLRKVNTIKDEDGNEVRLYEDLENCIEILSEHMTNMEEVGASYFPMLGSYNVYKD
tara:strand:+ start:1852 stop:2259 length:408 start_codon:yes stop_codon:yes gene_type:complete